MLPITGTFLDEITHDIPSQNWGEADWRREFALYKKIGIDTIIIIRAGYQNKCIFPAKSVPGLLPVYEDLGRIFLDLAEEFGLSLYWGTFDSGSYWVRRSWWKEVDLNKAFIDEVVERYGSSPAFKGWYLCHETSRNDSHIIELFRHIGGHCKATKDVPVLISPFPQGTKQFDSNSAFTLAESLDHWNRIFDETSEVIDICAFQDGQIQYHELPDFLRGVKDLGDRHRITIWSNVETFDRDMPIRFPPADWRYLRLKMEAASQTAEKLITFEFPHFISPHSVWPSAHNLFRRYCEHHELQAGEELK
ncbi:MAG: DUF4434 domain-containing protein [Fimbriimonadaceae bacterium]|jgi:hypothetical protein|nr:DUF4434 domain-containing protein [Fimbriimonadaceae bacterium]